MNGSKVIFKCLANLLVLFLCNALVGLVLVALYAPFDSFVGDVSDYLRLVPNWWLFLFVLSSPIFFPALFLVQFPFTSWLLQKAKMRLKPYLVCGLMVGLIHAVIFALIVGPNLAEPLNMLIKLGYILAGASVALAHFHTSQILLKKWHLLNP